jgi:ATP-binding cassette subfamily B protein
MDSAIMPVLTGIPNGWMLVGLVGLVPAFVSGTGTTVGFAVALGGVLLANRAFSGIAEGLASAARALIAWEQAGPLFRAAATAAAKSPFVPRRRDPGPRAPRLIEADGVTFRFLPQGEPVVDDVKLSVAHGDRILLEGASGGGKSTLASLLSGLRRPDAGLLLLNGLDRHTLGETWHHLATEAPQFHENHVFTATLGFNLLMGRSWPASEEELEEARRICAELGLDDLLQRMPSGLMQTVGETGWQLSHGERSRIFLARALLQGAQLTILDESFAALDPETLRTCLDCALRRAETLVVIAHP